MKFYILIENKRDEEGYVQKQLNERIKEKLLDIQEYRTSTIFAKTLNEELHVKMIEAEEKSCHALYGDLPADFFNDENVSTHISSKHKHLKERANEGRDISNHLQIPEKVIRKQSIGSMINFPEFDNDKAQFQQKAFKEASKILMKEYETRKAIRVRQRAVKIKAKNRILAVWSFRKKQQEKQKLGMFGKKKIENNKEMYDSRKTSRELKEENKEIHEVGNVNDSAGFNEVKDDSGIIGSIGSKTGDDNNNGEDKKENVNEQIGRKIVKVVNLRTRLHWKRQQQNLDNEYIISTKHALSEKEQFEGAQKLIERLTDLKQKRDGTPVHDAEEETKRVIPKFKDIVLRVIRIIAVKNAFKWKETKSSEEVAPNENEMDPFNNEIEHEIEGSRKYLTLLVL